MNKYRVYEASSHWVDIEADGFDVFGRLALYRWVPNKWIGEHKEYVAVYATGMWMKAVKL